MTNDELEDKYPHWRDALFGNHNAVANLRCAAHYVFWHGVYVLIAAAGLLVAGIIKSGKFISKYLGPLAGPAASSFEMLDEYLTRFANHEYTRRAGNALFYVFATAIMLAAIGMGVWVFITQFWTALTFIGFALAIIAVGIGATFAIGYFRDDLSKAADSAASTARQAGERAVQTPGVRRVYGECPVSLDTCPQWFENLFPEEDDV